MKAEFLNVKSEFVIGKDNEEKIGAVGYFAGKNSVIIQIQMKSTLVPLFLSMALFIFVGCSPQNKIENIVFISLDTTRADFIDSGRGARAHTPELRRFASRALVYDNAFCTIPQTLPSHLSMFSGRNPQELGVFGNEDVYDGRYPLLAQVLKDRGWRTEAVVSLGTLAAGTGINRGFERYYDRLHDNRSFFAPAQKVTDMALQRLQCLKKNKFFLFVQYSDPHTPYAMPSAQAPFTIELDGRIVERFNAYTGAILRLKILLNPGRHQVRFAVDAPADVFDFFIIRRPEIDRLSTVTMENLSYAKSFYNGSYLMRGNQGILTVHCRQAGEFKVFQVIPQLSKGASWENYRREVEYMDGEVGRLLRQLEKDNLLEKTTVIITADHGEGLGERESYFGHVRFLNRQFIHVPFFLHLPAGKPARVNVPVSLKAVAPMLLAALNLNVPGFPAANGMNPRATAEVVFPEPIASFTFAPAAGADRCSLIRWPWQMIVNRSFPGPESIETREYYDLRLSSSRKLEAIAPEVMQENGREVLRWFELYRPLWLSAFHRRSGKRPGAEPRKIDQLKTIGYLQLP